LRQMKKLTALTTIFLLWALSSPAWACSCMGTSPLDEAIQNSDVVFTGTVIDKQLVVLKSQELLEMFPEDTAFLNSPMASIAVYRYSFTWLEIFKGDISKDTIAIYTGTGGGDCGYLFETGGKYIVYGIDETYFGQANNGFDYPAGENVFWTNICFRTGLYNKEEVEEIRKHMDKKGPTDDREIFVNPEVPPNYKAGGAAGLNKFIRENLRYPKGQCIQGKVFVEFMVDESGNVTETKVVRGISKEADEEAVRLVKMLAFLPGTINGKAVKVRMVLPVGFSRGATKDE